jgi:putative FmdB family regulatory protein
MPIYEYDCPVCGRFEVLHRSTPSATGKGALTHCPTCEEKGKSSPVSRALAAPAVHFKGSGWYKTDYCSPSGGAKSSSSSSESSSGKAADSSAEGSKPAAKACGTGCGCH